MKKVLYRIQRIKITPKVYKNLPKNPGVYVYFKKGFPIYIGKAVNLKSRVSSYFRLSLETKTAKMMSEAEEIGYINVTNDLEALLLEARLIKSFQPKYNIISKDDKHPLYIVITKEKFPRIITARKNDLIRMKPQSVYGPFPSTTSVRSVLKMLRRIIPYCEHKLGNRPCIYSQIGLCKPCPNEIERSTDHIILKKKYLINIKHLKTILNGNASKVIKELEVEMYKFSNDENYEKAANIRNTIQKLNYIISPKASIDSYLENPNFAEDLREKELKELRITLENNGLYIKNLNRIECFDVAHLQGSSATASMVTFIKGVADKSYYRQFKIIQKNRRDDYNSMLEIASRRKKHLADWGIPDLIIVDGGKGQLSVFQKEFVGENIKIVGLAKRQETLVIPTKLLNSNTFIEFKLPKGPALNLIQRIRDEAHRFAQNYHHKLFKKSLFETGC